LEGCLDVKGSDPPAEAGQNDGFDDRPLSVTAATRTVTDPGAGSTALGTPPAPGARPEVAYARISGGGSSSGDLQRRALAARLSGLKRQLADLHSATARRSLDERKETRILVFALSAVLVFFFAASFVNQVEVRELHEDLEEEITRRADLTVDGLERSIETLRRRHLPSLKSSIESSIRELNAEDRSRLEKVEIAMRELKNANGRQAGQTLAILEDHLERVQKITHEIRDLQIRLLAKAEPSSEASSGRESQDAPAAPRAAPRAAQQGGAEPATALVPEYVISPGPPPHAER
jgi:hypothetical protein